MAARHWPRQERLPLLQSQVVEAHGEWSRVGGNTNLEGRLSVPVLKPDLAEGPPNVLRRNLNAILGQPGLELDLGDDLSVHADADRLSRSTRVCERLGAELQQVVGATSHGHNQPRFSCDRPPKRHAGFTLSV